MFTWSFGCISLFSPFFTPRISFARLAITSLAFMLVEVPEPVWNTSSTKWSSSFPSITSFAAFVIELPSLLFRRPSSMLAWAAASLIIPKALINVLGLRIPLIGKFSIALAVWAP